MNNKNKKRPNQINAKATAIVFNLFGLTKKPQTNVAANFFAEIDRKLGHRNSDTLLRSA